MAGTEAVLRVLVVDDEMPARLRLRDLLGDIREEVPNDLVGGVATGHEAERFLETRAVDVLLTDIHMPGLDGLALAKRLRERPDAPAVIFVTAYDEHALQAFDAAAVDYLVKPVTAARLREALERVRARMGSTAAAAAAAAPVSLDGVAWFWGTCASGKERVRLVETSFFRAQQKAVVAVTARGEFGVEHSLVQLEQQFGEELVRVSRSCLVVRTAVTGVRQENEDGAREITVRDSTEGIAVSRRQWAELRKALCL